MIWVAMLRGVNVGGAGKLPMAEFRGMLAGLGLRDVRTYIQSGNVVFDADAAREAVGAQIMSAVQARFGFAPGVFLRTADQMATALNHPFADQPGDKVHAVFLEETAPVLNTDFLDRWIAPSERWHLGAGIFYLFHPDGIGRSKLAARLERVIPCGMTARNIRTVAALEAMARTLS